MDKPTLLVQGMHGMGDSIHQRAVVKQMAATNEVYLETSWPSIYFDMPEVKLLRKTVPLRTQNKNAQRPSENARYSAGLGKYDNTIRVRYGGQQVLSTASKTVLEGMCNSVGADFASADYTFKVPEEWFEHWRKSSAYALWHESGKPLLVYRPLVSRTEWRGSGARNADPESYAKIFAAIRDDFFVISVADLVPSREWIVGPRLIADVEFHQGELTFESLAAVFSDASVVFTSSGFASVLAPAVGTTTINIVGGYEHSGAHSSGAKFAPFFSAGPTPPCECWSSACRGGCDKRLDTDAVADRVRNFLTNNGIELHRPGRPWTEMFVDGGTGEPMKTATIAQPTKQQRINNAIPYARTDPRYALMLSMQRLSASRGGNRA